MKKTPQISAAVIGFMFGIVISVIIYRANEPKVLEFQGTLIQYQSDWKRETYIKKYNQAIEKRIEVIKEVEVDRKFTTEKQQIMAYIVEVFGDDAADAITVINKCENNAFNPKATNHNRNGSIDRGVFQLNSAYWGGEELFDWKTNVDVAYKVFTRAGKKWTPWTCAHTVGQANYLGQ